MLFGHSYLPHFWPRWVVARDDFMASNSRQVVFRGPDAWTAHWEVYEDPCLQVFLMLAQKAESPPGLTEVGNSRNLVSILHTANILSLQREDENAKPWMRCPGKKQAKKTEFTWGGVPGFDLRLSQGQATALDSPSLRSHKPDFGKQLTKLPPNWWLWHINHPQKTTNSRTKWALIWQFVS